MLEKQVQIFKQELHAVTSGLTEVRNEAHQTNLVVGNIRDQINRLFWTGAGVFLGCSAIWTVGVVAWKAIKNGTFG